MPNLCTRTAHLALFFTLLLPALLCGTSARADAEPTKVLLGTATEGGGFQRFGQHPADVINRTGPRLRVEAIATRGSRQNLMLLEEGKIDIGSVEGNAARQALEGIGRAPAKFQVLSVMYPNPGMFVVRADLPYRNFEDLRGQPIAFGTRASRLRILATDVLDGVGLAPERDFEQVILEKGSTMCLGTVKDSNWPMRVLPDYERPICCGWLTTTPSTSLTPEHRVASPGIQAREAAASAR